MLLFNVLLFSAAIVPLLAYARDPKATQTRVEGLQKWVGADQRLVVASVAGVIGAYLSSSGSPNFEARRPRMTNDTAINGYARTMTMCRARRRPSADHSLLTNRR